MGEQSASENKPKSIKLEHEIRQKRISELSEDIASCKETMVLLEQQKSKFVAVAKYLQAAELVQQVSENRNKMRDLQSELGKIQENERRGTRGTIPR